MVSKVFTFPILVEMKQKINFVILLMTVCAVLMLVLQLYANYETYHSNERIFKSGVDGALKRSVTKLMNIRYQIRNQKTQNLTNSLTNPPTVVSSSCKPKLM